MAMSGSDARRFNSMLSSFNVVQRPQSSFWWQMFCCSWTTYLELTCQSSRQGSQLHRIQKTTENIHVLDGLRRIVTFWLLRLINTLTYLLTYLFTWQMSDRSSKMIRNLPKHDHVLERDHCSTFCACITLYSCICTVVSIVFYLYHKV